MNSRQFKAQQFAKVLSNKETRELNEASHLAGYEQAIEDVKYFLMDIDAIKNKELCVKINNLRTKLVDRNGVEIG